MVGAKKVTIIIPTRNRADTLHHTLRTCVMQDYDPLEILVSDNYSDDTTADVVTSINDPRVRRVRTPSRIGMSQNWEFALSHVDDGFVLAVGDDDALLPNAIRDVMQILDETNCEGIAWREAKYYWPGCGGGVRENTLRMSIRTGWRVESSREVMDRVLAYEVPYTRLPSLYWGMLSRDAIRRATGPSGRFFQSLNPDLYSALATSMVIDRFVWSERSYRINGMSRHSTGISFAAVDKSKQSPRDVFLNEGNLPFHPSFVLVPSSPLYVAEAYEQARQHVPGGDLRPPVALGRVMEHMMRVASTDKEVAYPLVIDGVREMGKRAGLDVEPTITRHPFVHTPQLESQIGLSIGQMTIKLDGNDFAVRDVYGAAFLAHTISRLFEAGYLSPRGIAKRLMDAVRSRFARVKQR